MIFRSARARVVVLGAVLLSSLVLPSVVRAQPGIAGPGAGRQRIRDQDKPTTDAKLDDALRKAQGTDLPERLEGLGQLGGLGDEPKAVEALLAAVNDPEPAVRIKAIDTLGRMRSADAPPVLIQLLLLRDTPVPVKKHILAALGQIGDPKATGALLDFLASSSDQTLRGSVVYALGELGDRSALDPLDQLAKNTSDDTIKRLVAEATQKINDRPGPALQPPSLAGSDRRPPQRAR